MGIDGDLSTKGCSLPQVIDYYRQAASPRRGGFFSSEFGPLGMGTGNSRRLISDVYHNYLWLGFATGSVGGPAPWLCEPQQDAQMNFYDLSGVNYLNAVLDGESYQHRRYGFPLNYYTEEILDSLLALSRLTSLMRWQYVNDSDNPNYPAYRPMRITKQEYGPGVTLRSGPGEPELSEYGWLWTGASDETVAVGWIVRDFDPDYNVPECEDPLVPAVPPYVEIAGLTAGVDLELVWFDDHRGIEIGERVVSNTGSFALRAPNTETGGFGKSIAFVIQPRGYTPKKYFDPLPNTMIGQIVVPAEYVWQPWWNDEWPWLEAGEIPFTVVTKPAITNPSAYRFDWYLYLCKEQDSEPYLWIQEEAKVLNGGPTVSFNLTVGRLYGWYRVIVVIKDLSGKRVSGDIIHPYL